MQLENEFSVPAPVSEVWKTLLDVERIAPCMPGATVERVDGGEVAGRVRVKVGPVTASYAGTASSSPRTRRPTASCSRAAAGRPGATGPRPRRSRSA
jgi:carbon monoxide dehydrogenase subunit G